ncbi:MAG: hypothetical protein DMG40_12055 [Acidobacteria bacterium]|nr:MAG: hypothetical protein DMG40_12055 [Acidobacteriota bacterium]
MRKLWLLSLLGWPLFAAYSDEPVPQGFDHWTSGSLASMSQALDAQAASDPHHFAVRQLSTDPNEYFLLARRVADGEPEWHETEADIFIVESGTGTLLVGGTLVGGEITAPHEKRNGTIQGGVRQKLVAGDVVRIPPRVPHQVLLDGGKEFTYLVVKVKGY